MTMYTGPDIHRIEPVEQNPDDLALAIIRGALPVQVRILEQQTVAIHPWSLCFAIIGESHFVALQHPNEQAIWTELLACTAITPEQCIVHRDFRHHKQCDVHFPGYDVCVQFHLKPPARMKTPDGQMQVEFPPVSGTTPITRIEWAISQERIIWQTLHTYPAAAQPDHAVFVWSETRLDIDRFQQFILEKEERK